MGRPEDGQDSAALRRGPRGRRDVPRYRDVPPGESHRVLGDDVPDRHVLEPGWKWSGDAGDLRSTRSGSRARHEDNRPLLSPNCPRTSTNSTQPRPKGAVSNHGSRMERLAGVGARSTLVYPHNITQRSLVQIQPPQPSEGPGAKAIPGLSCFSVSRLLGRIVRELCGT